MGRWGKQQEEGGGGGGAVGEKLDGDALTAVKTEPAICLACPAPRCIRRLTR